MNSFKIGEIAKLVITTPADCDDRLLCYHNSEVEVISELRYSPIYRRPEYHVLAQDGQKFISAVEYLRKRRPPEQPADDQDFIDWFNKTIKQEPLTESAMKRTLANLGAYMETK